MQMSDNFELDEFIHSQTATRLGYDEQFNPPESIKQNLTDLCFFVLEPIRTLIDKPIRISSGFRCERLNEAINGAKTSQHVKGQAADISAKGMTAEELYMAIKHSEIVVDQCIQEFGRWVHVSYCSTIGENRMQFLRAIKIDGQTKYIKDVSETA